MEDKRTTICIFLISRTHGKHDVVAVQAYCHRGIRWTCKTGKKTKNRNNLFENWIKEKYFKRYIACGDITFHSMCFIRTVIQEKNWYYIDGAKLNDQHYIAECTTYVCVPSFNPKNMAVHERGRWTKFKKKKAKKLTQSSIYFCVKESSKVKLCVCECVKGEGGGSTVKDFYSIVNM